MRVLAFIGLIVQCAFLRAQFQDSFNDGDLNVNPKWEFNATDFELLGNRLHSKNPGGGSVQFGIGSIANIESPNYISLDFELGINPSSSNYIDFFVCSDSLPLFAKNGYFIRIGDTKDNISFYQLKNGIKYLLLAGKDGVLNTTGSHMSIRLIRLKGGFWKLYRYNFDNESWLTEGISADTSILRGKYVGIKIQQNGTTAAGKHFLDNIKIGKYTDTAIPKVTQISSFMPNQIDFYFQKGMGVTNSSNFKLDGTTNPINAIIDPNNEAIIHLLFKDTFQFDKQYTIWHSQSSDYFGNLAGLSKTPFNILKIDTPMYGDIIINEVMSNPSPTAGLLPEDEYVEIHNISNKRIVLTGCSFGDGATKTTLTERIISAGEYLLLCSKTSSYLNNPKIQSLGLNAFPSLNNDGDYIFLHNQNNVLINEINYTDKWHSASWKKQGGWSLERKDSALWCINTGNWESCKNDGGSPGKKNSISSVIIPKEPILERIYCQDSLNLWLYFNHPLDGLTAANKNNYTLEENNQNPIATDPQGSAIRLTFTSAIARNKIYHLKVSNLKSCFGNKINEVIHPFGLAKNEIDSPSLQINEVLFDPNGETSDFVEFINISPDIIDLKNTRIANRNSNGNIDQVTTISQEGYNLLPGEFALLTTDRTGTMAEYNKHNADVMIELSNLPTFANDNGNVLLLNFNGEILDEMIYSYQMHSPIISATEGISLEKIRPELNSMEPTNWASAAASSGFGTPGMPNSQFISSNELQNSFMLNPAWFSPDNDGLNDILSISYKLDKAGYFLTATIFSESGVEIANIFRNFTLEQEGEIFWNGSYNGSAIGLGNYILYLDLFHTNGSTIRKKLTFSVLKKY